ncbi:protein sax-3 [Hyalella azteca]|uniref:Protein sax-3 n=1 Tax=Hyalella azteca TaxID=294128 RepID=A0A8B7NIL1_HYAAZ|nr:protein sax-3 [Hyalella azteca]
MPSGISGSRLLLAVSLAWLLADVQGQYRSPSIVEHPADVLVRRGEPATLNCQADGKPEPRISWYKNAKPLQFTEVGRHVVLAAGDLFFLQVMQDAHNDDTGVYWCVASNTVGSIRSNNATVEIAELGEEFLQVPQNTRVGEGEVAMLECQPPPGSPPPVVTWSKDGRPLDPAVNHRLSCSPPATLTVLVKPHLVSSSGDVTTESGATVELVCRVGGDPQPEVFWGRVSPAGAQLPHERLTQEEQGQVLRLRHVSPEDAGVYSCTAENPVGIVATNTSLIVHSMPVFTKKPKDARVGVAGTARFECVIAGSPEPTTYWTHEGSGLIVSLGQTWAGGRVSVDGHNTLTIVGVQEEDSGYYACVGVGEAGSAIARAYLEVQGVSDMPPPIIAVGASNQTLPLGTEAELPCEATGTPEPQVLWSFQGQPIDPSSVRHSVTPLGTLRIVGLLTSDSGIYTCTATSIAGSSQWQASLAVHKATNPNIPFHKMFWDSDLPEPPQNLMVLLINSTQVTLGWSRGRPGSSSIRSHSVQYWSPDLRGPWREATIIQPQHHIATPLGTTVTNLVPSTRYVFTVRSRNKDWVSRPATFTNVIRTLDSDRGRNSLSGGDVVLSLGDARMRLNSATVRLVAVEAISSTSLKVSWRFVVNDISVLDGVYVRYRPLNDKNQPVGALSVEIIRFPTRGERSTANANDNEMQANPPDFISSHSRIDSSPPKFLSSSRDHPHAANNPPTSHTIDNLRPATSYEIFVVPFHRTIEGQPTSSMRRTTMVAPIFAMPTGLHFKAINETCVQVSWDPLPASLEIAGRLKGYNLQGVEASNDHVLVYNSTTNATTVIVSNLKPGVAYDFSVRGLTSLGLGPPSDILRFVPSIEYATKTVPNNSIPSSTAASNTYMIIAIVCAAILVSSFLLGAVIYIYRKRNLSKCPHYFSSKADSCTGPWSAHSGCWEDGSNTGAISTTRYNDGTVSAMNNTRYNEGTPAGLTNIRYTDLCGNATTIYTDGGGQFYVANDSKSGYEIRASEDMMYEDPEGLRLVSFKGRHNLRCASPEPYATTPLIAGCKDPAYPRSQKGTKMSASRLPPNIPNIPPAELTHNFNTHSDKGSMVSGPILQFPPPPPPPLNAAEGGGSSSSTTASSNSRGAVSNNAPSRGGSSQHLFLQHLPYHTTAGSNSSASHHTSPLLHPRQSRSPASQVSPNNVKTSQVSPTHLLSNGNFQNQHRAQNVCPVYGQNEVDPFIHANNIIAARNQDNKRAGLENWLNTSVGKPTSDHGFTAGAYFLANRRCNSPESSAMGDADESDDKEGEESCWSEGSHGTNENEVSTNGSVSGSMSSLNPDLNWTEAVRLMSENKWPHGSPKRPSDAVFNKFSSITDAASNAYVSENNAQRIDEEMEAKRKLLSGNHYPTSSDNLVHDDGNSFVCSLPPDGINAINNRNSSKKHDAASSSEGNKLRNPETSHSRKTSITSPLV